MFGFVVQRTKKFKKALVIISIMSLLMTLANAYCLTTGNAGLVTATSFFMGFVLVPILPIGFELGVEITYPVDESYSAGMLMSIGQIIGFVFVRISKVTNIDYHMQQPD